MVQGESEPLVRLLTRPGWARRPAWADPGLAEWFADHARDLGQRFAAPLLRWEAAARAAESAKGAPADAPRSVRAAPIVADAAVAATAVVDRTLSAYARLAERHVRERRLGWRGRRVAAVEPAVASGLRRDADRAVEELRVAVEGIDAGAGPEGRRAAMAGLEQAWADAWEDLGGAVDRAWREALGPALIRLEQTGGRRGPWLAVALLATAGALVAAALWMVF